MSPDDQDRVFPVASYDDVYGRPEPDDVSDAPGATWRRSTTPKVAPMSSSYDPFRMGLITTNLGDVRPERVRWIWDGRLAMGKLTALDGLPDLGKSTIAVDVSGRVTTGRPMPDGPNGLDGPTDVVLFSAEDGLADTVAPRMDAAGGDRKRVHVVTATQIVDDEGGLVTRWPDLKRDVELLRATVEDARAGLVVIDVLMAYLDARTNSYRDQDMRSVLGPLAKMAEQTGCAVLFLRHPTKSGARDPILAGGGSIGIIGAARVGLLASFHPEDDQLPETARRRLLAVGKCNVAAKAPTLVYRLAPPDGHDVAAVRAGDITKAAYAAGIARMTLHRARKRLGITTEKAGFESGWWWVLPVEGPVEDPEGP